jgi:hypothetical protein
MTSPILPLIHTITQDRIREAENARLARSVAPERPAQSRRPIRALRLAFSR